MTIHATLMRRTALATLAILPLAGLPAQAQTQTESQTGSQTEQTQTGGAGQTGTDATGSAGTQAGTAAEGGASADALDAVVARVGPIDILTSDVMMQIGMLPERFQAQPPELLVPMALEQLVLRQVILQQATTQELATDPQVQAAAEAAAQAARENVLVQTFIERELADRVTDEEVQALYDQMDEASEAELPPLEALRPQIEQRLRQQEIAGFSREMLESDLVVFYGPDGAPVAASEFGLGGGAADGAGAGTSGEGMAIDGQAVTPDSDGGAAGAGEDASGEGATEEEEAEQDGG